MIKLKLPQIRLINGDCLDVMNDIKGESIDMILCDLPYGTTKCKWDIQIPFDVLWKHYDRIIKPNGVVVLFSTEPFTSHLLLSNLNNYRQKLTWLKTRPTNVFNAKKQFMNWIEDILIFYKNLPKFNPIMRTDGEFTGRKIQRMNTDRSKSVFDKTGEKKDYVHEGNGGLFYPKTVLEFSNVHHGNECYHPTQKPVALCEYLIKTYTDEGDIVLDNCMGSGTTGIACKNLNRRFIGIEKDPEIFEIARNRINKRVEDDEG